MEEFILIVILLLFFVGLPLGIGFLFYWVPKRLGYPKVAKYLTITYFVLLVAFVLSFVFEDSLFFKSDAQDLLSEHKIELNDSFKIISNKSGGLFDYYHQFTLEISETDKEKLIQQFTSEKYYKEDIFERFDLREGKSRHSEKDASFQVAYQNKGYYVYEYFKPNKKGVKPIWDKVKISKSENELTYLRILD